MRKQLATARRPRRRAGKSDRPAVAASEQNQEKTETEQGSSLDHPEGSEAAGPRPSEERGEGKLPTAFTTVQRTTWPPWDPLGPPVRCVSTAARETRGRPGLQAPLEGVEHARAVVQNSNLADHRHKLCDVDTEPKVSWIAGDGDRVVVPQDRAAHVFVDLLGRRPLQRVNANSTPQEVLDRALPRRGSVLLSVWASVVTETAATEGHAVSAGHTAGTKRMRLTLDTSFAAAGVPADSVVAVAGPIAGGGGSGDEGEGLSGSKRQRKSDDATDKEGKRARGTVLLCRGKRKGGKDCECGWSREELEEKFREQHLNVFKDPCPDDGCGHKVQMHPMAAEKTAAAAPAPAQTPATEGWNLSSILRFCGSHSWALEQGVRTGSYRTTLVHDVTLPLVQREMQGLQVLRLLSKIYDSEQWQRVGYLDSKSGYHVCIPATPGLGKSRLLQALAGPPGTSGDMAWKRSLLTKAEQDPDISKTFLAAFSTAVGVLITFNNQCERSLDPTMPSDSKDPVYAWDISRALGARLLWNFFVNPTVCSYTEFVTFLHRNLYPTAVPTFVEVVKAILEDCGDRNLIVCVDECAAVGKESDVGALLSTCSAVFSANRKVHCLISSVSYDYLSNCMPQQSPGTQRNIEYAQLDRLRWDQMDALLAFQAWWRTQGISGEIRRMCTIAIRASVGCPRLFLHVTEVLQRMVQDSPSMFTWQVFVERLAGKFQFKSLAVARVSELLPRAAKMALAGKPLAPRHFDTAAVAGLILRSHQEQETVPVLSPLWLLVRARNIPVEDDLCKWVAEFFGYTPWQAQDAAISGKQFEPQTSLLFRIRLRLQESRQISPKDLLTVTVPPQACGDQAATGTFDPFGEYSIVYFGHQGDISLADFKTAMHQKNLSQTRIYMPMDRAAAGYDFFIVHQGNFLTVVQVKFSQFNSGSTISNQVVAKSINDTLTSMPEILEHGLGCFVFFAKRASNKNVSIDKIGALLPKHPSVAERVVVCHDQCINALLTPSLNIFDLLLEDPAMFQGAAAGPLNSACPSVPLPSDTHSVLGSL